LQYLKILLLYMAKQEGEHTISEADANKLLAEARKTQPSTGKLNNASQGVEQNSAAPEKKQSRRFTIFSRESTEARGRPGFSEKPAYYSNQYGLHAEDNEVSIPFYDNKLGKKVSASTDLTADRPGHEYPRILMTYEDLADGIEGNYVIAISGGFGKYFSDPERVAALNAHLDAPQDQNVLAIDLLNRKGLTVSVPDNRYSGKLVIPARSAMPRDVALAARNKLRFITNNRIDTSSENVQGGIELIASMGKMPEGWKSYIAQKPDEPLQRLHRRWEHMKTNEAFFELWEKPLTAQYIINMLVPLASPQVKREIFELGREYQEEGAMGHLEEIFQRFDALKNVPIGGTTEAMALMGSHGIMLRNERDASDQLTLSQALRTREAVTLVVDRLRNYIKQIEHTNTQIKKHAKKRDQHDAKMLETMAKNNRQIAEKRQKAYVRESKAYLVDGERQGMEVAHRQFGGQRPQEDPRYLIPGFGPIRRRADIRASLPDSYADDRDIINQRALPDYQGNFPALPEHAGETVEPTYDDPMNDQYDVRHTPLSDMPRNEQTNDNTSPFDDGLSE
jgi:hypothetical protein